MIKVSATGIREFIGWLGVALVLSAYILLTLEVISANSWQFHLMNLVGAIFLINSSLKHHDLQPVAVNGIWAIIATIGLIAIFF